MIIAVANQKGGVGKTTIAVHLAIGASLRGKRVALIDADPQGNATSWLMDGNTDDAGLFNLLVVERPIVECVRFVSRWSIGLLPGNPRTDEAMRFLSVTDRLGSIPGKIAPLRDSADVVMIDMPPSRSAGFQDLLRAADYVIVPTQLERLALEGVGLMAQTAQALHDGGRGPRLLAVVPNMVRLVREHREQLRLLVEQFGGVVWPPIPLSVRVAEACAYGRSLFEMGQSDPIGAAMTVLVDRFMVNVFGEEVKRG